jgi:hypothetical protein
VYAEKNIDVLLRNDIAALNSLDRGSFARLGPGPVKFDLTHCRRRKLALLQCLRVHLHLQVTLDRPLGRHFITSLCGAVARTSKNRGAMDRSNFFTRLVLAATIVLVSMLAVGRAADVVRPTGRAMPLSRVDRPSRSDCHAIERHSHPTPFPITEKG